MLVLCAALVLGAATACRKDAPVQKSVPDSQSVAIESGLDAAIERAKHEHKPIFAHFTATWCVPCRELKANVYPSEIVAERLTQFVRAEIDIDSKQGEQAAHDYEAHTVPVLIFLSPEGEELRDLRIVGATSPDALAKSLDKVLTLTGQPSAYAGR